MSVCREHTAVSIEPTALAAGATPNFRPQEYKQVAAALPIRLASEAHWKILDDILSTTTSVASHRERAARCRRLWNPIQEIRRPISRPSSSDPRYAFAFDQTRRDPFAV